MYKHCRLCKHCNVGIRQHPCFDCNDYSFFEMKEIIDNPNDIAILKSMLCDVEKKEEPEMVNETKEELNNQIKELEKKIKRLEDKVKYDEAANEMKNVMDSFVEAGFTEEQAFSLVMKFLSGAFEMAKR